MKIKVVIEDTNPQYIHLMGGIVQELQDDVVKEIVEIIRASREENPDAMRVCDVIGVAIALSKETILQRLEDGSLHRE